MTGFLRSREVVVQQSRIREAMREGSTLRAQCCVLYDYMLLTGEVTRFLPRLHYGI